MVSKFFERFQVVPLVLKWQAVLGYLMFPIVLQLFRVLFGCLAARSLTHGTYMVHRETFF